MSLEIVDVYQTSVGYFRTLEEASRKKNCPKTTGGGWREPNVREMPKMVSALIDIDTQRVFRLENIDLIVE